MQHSAFIDDKYQEWRKCIIDDVVLMINNLNPELVSAKLQLGYVEKYKTKAAFVCLSDMDKHNLQGFQRRLCFLEIKEGNALDPAYDFEDYRLKVNKYIEENKNSVAIHKLRNNIPLTSQDYSFLEHILTGELGTKSDYEREFGSTPFGLLVRKIAKLEYDAAMQAFSEFINDQSLNQMQIVFVKKIVDYIAHNGFVEYPSELMKPPLISL